MAVVNETKHNGIPHEFKNLGNEKKQGKNALIFDGESVVSIRYAKRVDSFFITRSQLLV